MLGILLSCFNSYFRSRTITSDKSIPALEGLDLDRTVVMGSTASVKFSPFLFLNSSLYLETLHGEVCIIDSSLYTDGCFACCEHIVV
jgi:hypothetical protein